MVCATLLLELIGIPQNLIRINSTCMRALIFRYCCDRSSHIKTITVTSIELLIEGIEIRVRRSASSYSTADMEIWIMSMNCHHMPNASQIR